MLFLVTHCHEGLGLSQEDRREAMHAVMRHDASKFSLAQFMPYVELTEYFRQRKKLGNDNYNYPTREIEKSTKDAWKAHYQTENHHPEKYKGQARQFTITECLEIVCDLQAMAQEFGEGSCRKFFEEIWRKEHIGYFQYDDFHYANSMGMMRRAIDCFECEEKK